MQCLCSVIGSFFNCQMVTKFKMSFVTILFFNTDKDNLGYTKWILMGKKQYGIQSTLDDTSCGVNTGTN